MKCPVTGAFYSAEDADSVSSEDNVKKGKIILTFRRSFLCLDQERD